jgi:hypothetical protein
MGWSGVGCDVMRCDAMRCDAMRCDAMRCDAMRCDAMRCDAMRCDARKVAPRGLQKWFVDPVSALQQGSMGQLWVRKAESRRAFDSQRLSRVW